MLSLIWTTLLIKPIFNFLMLCYFFVGNLGVSIILFTLFVRALMVPMTIPSIRSMNKQKDLQPEIQKIREKYKNNKQKQAEAQMALFKTHGLNPASGCISQIPVLIILFAVFGVINEITTFNGNAINSYVYFDFLRIAQESINLKLLYLDMGKPDPYYVLPVLSGLAQFAVSKVSFPAVSKGEKLAKKTTDKTDDIAYNVQQQMLYIMPLMTAYISTKLPSGVVLYIITTSLFSFVQTYILTQRRGIKSLITRS